MPKLGLDEQKPDTRPATLGNAAMDADARNSLGSVDGRSGEARGKDSKLNLGGLSLCEDTPNQATTLSVWQHAERGREKSAETVVVCSFTWMLRTKVPACVGRSNHASQERMKGRIR